MKKKIAIRTKENGHDNKSQSSPSLISIKTFIKADDCFWLEKDQDYRESKAKGIYLQVPLKQQIVFYQPAKEKPSFLTTLVKKLRRVSNALLQTEDEEISPHNEPQPHISNSLSYNVWIRNRIFFYHYRVSIEKSPKN